ncbi:MAG: trypsin-like peptidase domain-containing protein [Acidobacteriia bacterium]|nr:trypsin-like peptidase domain-containing protein [Terriglobia bacterium]
MTNKDDRYRLSAGTRIFFLAFLVLMFYVVWRMPHGSGRDSEVPPDLLAQLQVKDVAAASDASFSNDEMNNIQIYRAVNPSVVNITTETVSYDFFFMPVPSTGAGSGFVIDSDGHILTNFHVVDGARRLEVTLSDKSKYSARFVGGDRSSDLAVIRVNAPASKLHPVKLGDSTNLQVGQKALAIGNPFGLAGTLTTGVISSLGRSIRAENDRVIENAIQTDASINPGNSGGPLLNSRGEVIGINSQIASPSGGSVGVGFAIPINNAKGILKDLITVGRVKRAFLGIRGYSVDPELADILRLPVDHGVLVARVTRGGSADRAGIRGGDQWFLVGNQRMTLGGDLIVAVDGKQFDSDDQVNQYVESKAPGERVSIELYRGNKKMTVAVPLVERVE